MAVIFLLGCDAIMNLPPVNGRSRINSASTAVRQPVRCRASADPHAVIDFNQIADAARWLEWCSFSELAAVLGYFFGMITAFTAGVALAIAASQFHSRCSQPLTR
jgi:hypothetical protein